MTPLLFPHTCPAPEMLAAAARFFSELMLYQPAGDGLPDGLVPWVQDGFLKVRVPVSEDGEMVAAAVREYREWARQHQGGRQLKSFLPQGTPAQPPFFGDTATAQILSDLKSAGRSGATGKKRLFTARLFLALAQHWDQEQQELDRRLKRAEADARALIDELQSENSAAALRLPRDSRQGLSEFMLAERLDAWRLLFLADSLEPALLVTTSRSIISDFVTGAEKAEPLLRLDAATAPRTSDTAPDASFRDSLMKTLETVCRRPWPFEDRIVFAAEDAGEAADLTLYLIPNRSARMFMADLKASRAPARIQAPPDGAAPQHLIVGFLNPDGPGSEPETGPV